eukprot:GHVT01090548.1.p1 GENE.GHVT01090548.1~~GHVT01090548.1.p1  ORF type:complete len:357 (-),score=57.17 GHVT01090548.1:1624-2694(-)
MDAPVSSACLSAVLVSVTALDVSFAPCPAATACNPSSRSGRVAIGSVPSASAECLRARVRRCWIKCGAAGVCASVPCWPVKLRVDLREESPNESAVLFVVPTLWPRSASLSVKSTHVLAGRLPLVGGPLLSSCAKEMVLPLRLLSVQDVPQALDDSPRRRRGLPASRPRLPQTSGACRANKQSKSLSPRRELAGTGESPLGALRPGREHDPAAREPLWLASPTRSRSAPPDTLPYTPLAGPAPKESEQPGVNFPMGQIRIVVALWRPDEAKAVAANWEEDFCHYLLSKWQRANPPKSVEAPGWRPNARQGSSSGAKPTHTPMNRNEETHGKPWNDGGHSTVNNPSSVLYSLGTADT